MMKMPKFVLDEIDYLAIHSRAAEITAQDPNRSYVAAIVDAMREAGF
jgi:hypothetical protein